MLTTGPITDAYPFQYPEEAPVPVIAERKYHNVDSQAGLVDLCQPGDERSHWEITVLYDPHFSTSWRAAPAYGMVGMTGEKFRAVILAGAKALGLTVTDPGTLAPAVADADTIDVNAMPTTLGGVEYGGESG